jgi:TolB-like protein/Tfp pilus assembly protein PilF
VTEPSHAVFLSYASQDAQAALRICEALRVAGIEVWFDQSELRGGDAWDHSIRRQIKNCALFIPLISQNTHDRDEGYFRLEWKLAVDRSHLMAADKAFLLPVVIDATAEADERTPERFREVQWTALPAGVTTAAFVERVRRLLSRDMPSAADPPSASASGSRTVRPPRGLIGRRRGVLYGAIVVVVLLALGYFGLERHKALKPGVAGAASIAVLPLTNEIGEAGERYFSDGISEDLITALSQFPGLKVIGRSSSFQFRDSKEDGRSIGAKLGVAHLLEGSVRKSGDMIRVSTELINTSDGSTQWSQRYDRPYKDLFALQDEITYAVAGELKTKLLPDAHAAAQSERPPGGSLEAYNAMLQGRFHARRFAEADVRKSIELFTQATRLDPRYAYAWSQLSVAWTDLGAEYFGGAPAQEMYVKAREAVEHALALSPDLAAAHLARGFLLQSADLDWRGAQAEARRAVQLAPDDGNAKFNLGGELAIYGELEHAIELTRQALVTDPLRADWYAAVATYLLGLNRLDEAEKSFRRAIELQPGVSRTYTLTVIEVQRGQAQLALEVAQQAPAGVFQDIAVALALQIGNDRNAADAALRTLVEKHADEIAYQIAEVYALRGDATATFEWLDRAWRTRDSGILQLLFDPLILRYKDDPRFAAFCRKVGLPVPGASDR